MVKFQYCFVKHWLTHVSMDFYLRKVNYNEDIMTVSRYNFYSKSQSHSQENMKMCNATQPHPLLFFISDNTLSIAIGASIGILVVVVVVGVVIWWVLKRGSSRKGDYSIPRMILMNLSRLEFYKSGNVSFCFWQISANDINYTIGIAIHLTTLTAYV